MTDTHATTKAFVTGGAGFIGSHLVDRLLGQGATVTVYDNLASGKRRWIERHLTNPRFRLVHADLLDTDNLVKSIRGHNIVWHFGANTDIPSGFANTDLDLKNCVVGTCNLLDAMRQAGVRDLMFASSGSVYGEVDIVPTPETAGPLLPLSLYAAGKLSCEAFIAAYCGLFGLRAWIFRFGNVIGPRMGHGAIYDFIQKLRKNSAELEILGDGRQEKNYFTVDECLDGMQYANTHIPMTDQKPCDIFNLGAASCTRVTTIAQIVIEEMGLKDVKIRFTGGRGGWPGDQPQVHLVFDKMASYGWRARRSSDEAVREAARAVLADPV